MRLSRRIDLLRRPVLIVVWAAPLVMALLVGLLAWPAYLWARRRPVEPTH